MTELVEQVLPGFVMAVLFAAATWLQNLPGTRAAVRGNGAE